jgi:hypothetical protein
MELVFLLEIFQGNEKEAEKTRIRKEKKENFCFYFHS